MATRNLIHWVNDWTNTSPSGYDVLFDFHPESILKEFDDTFNKLWASRSCPVISDNASLPRTNIYENEDGLVIEAFVPYVEETDEDTVKVTVDPLTNGIKIEVDSHQDENIKKYHLREVSRSSFKRTFAIDKRFDTDIAKCDLKNGILKITIPFAENAKEFTIFTKD